MIEFALFESSEIVSVSPKRILENGILGGVRLWLFGSDGDGFRRSALVNLGRRQTGGAESEKHLL